MAQKEKMPDSSGQKPLFRNIDADDDDPEVTEIESFCVNCEKQGVTRLFLTRIPFFREVVVASFTCDHCGYKNAELEPAGKIQDKGVNYELRVTCVKDLNRQVVQTGSATVRIPELDFETPPNKGALLTIEGVIQRAIDGLSQDQEKRKIDYPDIAAQIDRFINKLEELREVKTPFHFIIDDPCGNSFIENPHVPSTDPEMKVTYYKRTKEQCEALGLAVEMEPDPEPKFNARDEVLQFPANCPNCNAPCTTNMKLVNIPHFKEVVIMATDCDACGFRENEVKGGSGIAEKGTRIKLKLTDISDMSRDVLKSDLCLVQIPELDFTTALTSMPGKFTTVEGLLSDIINQMKKFNPFLFGDSSEEDKGEKINKFCDKIDKIKSGETLGVHIVLDDPTGNSYLQNVYAPDPDPEMTIEHYERTQEQNDDLGITDMKTENYEKS